MRHFLLISFAVLLQGCIFTYDPAPGKLHIRNNTDQAVYVYLKYGEADVLPLEPKLELFEFFDNEDGSMQDSSGNPLKSCFVSPEYRINAYDLGSLIIGGSANKPRLRSTGLLSNEKGVTLFFITEKTMRSYDWEEIYQKQMFVKKKTFTQEELENSNWTVTYP